MKKKSFLTWLTFLAALLLQQSAFAANNYRFTTIRWAVPDPVGAPLTVQFTVTSAWASPGTGSPVLDFGDGTNSGPLVSAVVGSGTSPTGNLYTARRVEISHTYPSASTFVAKIQDCCRDTVLINGAGGPIEVRSVVDLSAGNTGGPVVGTPMTIHLRAGAPQTVVFTTHDPDLDLVTCRFASASESALPAGQAIPAVPVGGTLPSLQSGSGTCILTWNLSQAVPGQHYTLALVFESSHNGIISSSPVDLTVETTGAVPPTCTGSGVFLTGVGQQVNALLLGTQAQLTNLTLSAINMPPTATLTPGGSSPSPFNNTFLWTPASSDAGTTRVVIVNYTNGLNVTGGCTVTVQVASCTGLGLACTAGVGQCQASGVNICTGINMTSCSATPGQPTAEVCDNLDNDCDGTVDNGNPGGGAACTTALPGACAPGTQVCTSGALVCTSIVSPGSLTETCDGTDEDCDGAIDSGLGLGNTCMSGVGSCATTGMIACDGMGAAACDAIPGSPVAEVCGDALDNDCDGIVDNGCQDSDNDGLSDPAELLIGTDPADADSDDDGVLDGLEPSPGLDSDGDLIINALDPDSDNDGLFDGTELGFDCSNPATNLANTSCIPDADGGATTTDPLDADTDGGTVKDGTEDANHDGHIDPGERDPNDPTDDVPVPECIVDADCGAIDSGVVCDDIGQICVPGCRGMGGNGCPSGEQCTSSNTNIGGCVTLSECVKDSDCGGPTSGKVCDAASEKCIDGCRGTGGNGCPAGEECSSQDSSIGTCTEVLGCQADSECGPADSGRVCDESTAICVNGCRGTGGNGCPEGESCSSADSVIGQCLTIPECETDADCGDAASGRICEPGGTCGDGCHGDGNGCPSGQVCSSADESPGVCASVTEPPAEEVLAQGDGLLCSASPGSGSGGERPLGILIAAAAALVWRRRSQRKGSRPAA